MPDNAKATAESTEGKPVTALVGELPKRPALPLLGPDIEFTPDSLRAYSRGFSFGVIVGASAASLALAMAAMFGWFFKVFS